MNKAVFGVSYEHIARSSKGRTSLSESENFGSIPSLAALRLASLAQCEQRRSVLSGSTALTAGESRRTYYLHMYFLYLIQCEDNSIYTGITTNVERRFNEHKSGIGGHFTRSRRVVKILYTEQHLNRSSALKREAQIKGWRRQKKLNLIKFGKLSVSKERDIQVW